MRQAHQDGGYTLLELLIATILSGFLLIAVTDALRYIGLAKAHIDRSEADFRDIDAAKKMISQILANAQPVLKGAAYADRTLDFDGSVDRVQLIGLLPDAIADDQIAREDLSLVENGPSKGLWLSWSLTLPSAQDDTTQPIYRMKIADKVRSLRFAFFGSDTPLHSPIWRSSWTALSSLPLLVKVEIKRVDTKETAPLAFFVAPQVFATPGCRFDSENVACRRVQ